VAEQMPYVQGLVANFNKTAHEANRFGFIVSDITKDIPGLTMSEALQDVTSMADQTKIFNISLLDTLSLYNTLIRKSEIWGATIGAAPRAVQKDIAKTVAGWGLGLSRGIKIALGREMGVEGGPAAQVLGFEKAFAENMGSAVKGMTKWITKRTSGLGGAQKELAIRDLLQEHLGFKSKESSMTMAKAFGKGEMTPEKMDALIQELAKNKQAAEKAAKAYDKNLKSLVAEGASILKRMASLQKRIDNWIKENLRKPVSELMETLRELTAAFKSSWFYKGVQTGKETEKDIALRSKWGKVLESPETGAMSKTTMKLKTQRVGFLAESGKEYLQDMLKSEKLYKKMAPELEKTKLGKEVYGTKLAGSKLIMGEIGRRAIVEALSLEDLDKLGDMIKRNAQGEMLDFLTAQLKEKTALNVIRQHHGTGMVETKTPKGTARPARVNLGQ